MKIVKFGIANKIVTMTTLLVLFSSVGLGIVFYSKDKQCLIHLIQTRKILLSRNI
ncbi:MAG: hypothetical protein QGG38_03175 [Nitrospinaceae bacterium]|nr:hypothetical protein [Nitrospinaceae bacterium]MDP6711674.1 hypothetical protein [Nitrospinaceae bacterium]MDP7057769.1 hypothetical protein [Nitrospinaceae bacterium]|tara:strand:- start:4559 stop:4723 length:165 start_codon:yes stop_codon:yes gene_type:complete